MTDVAAPSLAEVGRDWLEWAGGPRRLQREDVFEIAWRLVRAGIQPTVEAIRQVNTKGSPNTIHPHLKEFFAGELTRRWKSPPPASALPDPVAQLWEQLKTTAREAVLAELQPQRDEIAQQAKALDRREEHLLKQTLLLEEREIGMSGQIKTLESELTDARQQRDIARTERDQQASALESLRGEHQQTTEQLVAVRTTAADLTAQRDALQNDLDAAEQKLEAAYQRMDAERLDWGKQRDALQSDLKTSAEQLATMRGELSELKGQVARLEGELTDARSKREADRATWDEQRNALLGAQQALSSTVSGLRSELEQVRQERDKLDKRLTTSEQKRDSLQQRVDDLVEQLAQARKDRDKALASASDATAALEQMQASTKDAKGDR